MYIGIWLIKDNQRIFVCKMAIDCIEHHKPFFSLAQAVRWVLIAILTLELHFHAIYVRQAFRLFRKLRKYKILCTAVKFPPFWYTILNKSCKFTHGQVENSGFTTCHCRQLSKYLLYSAAGLFRRVHTRRCQNEFYCCGLRQQNQVLGTLVMRTILIHENSSQQHQRETAASDIYNTIRGYLRILVSIKAQFQKSAEFPAVHDNHPCFGQTFIIR